MSHMRVPWVQHTALDPDPASWKAVVMVQVFEFLPPRWETGIEFPDPSFGSRWAFGPVNGMPASVSFSLLFEY